MDNKLAILLSIGFIIAMSVMIFFGDIGPALNDMGGDVSDSVNNTSLTDPTGNGGN